MKATNSHGQSPHAAQRSTSVDSFRRWRSPLTGIATASFLLSDCAAQSNALAPRGPAAGSIATLWWFMFWTGLAVYIIVIGLLLFATMRG